MRFNCSLSTCGNYLKPTWSLWLNSEPPLTRLWHTQGLCVQLGKSRWLPDDYNKYFHILQPIASSCSNKLIAQRCDCFWLENTGHLVRCNLSPNNHRWTVTDWYCKNTCRQIYKRRQQRSVCIFGLVNLTQLSVFCIVVILLYKATLLSTCHFAAKCPTSVSDVFFKIPGWI